MTFPEYRQAAEAAVKYINDYKGGIGGHPVKLEQLRDRRPAVHLRALRGPDRRQEAGVHPRRRRHRRPGAFPVWKRADLAVPRRHPVHAGREQRAERRRSSSRSRSATTPPPSTYAVKKLGVKKAAVIYTDDTQGKFTGLGVIATVLKAQGVDVKTDPGARRTPRTSRPSPPSAIESQPDMVYVNSPNACPGMLKALKSVGNTAKIFGIDPCTSPPALKAAGDAAEGLYFAQPFDSLDSGTDDAKLMLAAMQKYGARGRRARLDRAGRLQLGDEHPGARSTASRTLDTQGDPGAFKDGQAHPNFLAHEYTCDGKQLPGATAVCNAYQQMKQVKGGKVITVDDQWVTGAEHYTPPAASPAVAAPCPRTSSSCCSAWGRAPSTASSPWAWCSSTARPAVVDFGHGAVAMFIAYVYLGLRDDGALQLPWVDAARTSSTSAAPLATCRRSSSRSSTRRVLGPRACTG